MKKVLLTINYIVFSLLVLFTSSCKEKDYTYESFLKLDSSHKLSNQKVKTYIEEYIGRNSDYEYYKTNTGLIVIDKKNDSYNICMTIVDYKIFKENRGENFKEVQGYTKINELPVLLFGDIDDIFTIIKGSSAKKKLLGELPVFSVENPPIIFEPTYECSELKNGEMSNIYKTFDSSGKGQKWK